MVLDHLPYKGPREKPLQENRLGLVGPFLISKKPVQVICRGLHPSSLYGRWSIEGISKPQYDKVFGFK
jgi:hypothetical protein